MKNQQTLTAVVVLVLVAVAGFLVWRDQSGGGSGTRDPRVGVTILDADVLSGVSRIEIRSGSTGVDLTTIDGGFWQIAETSGSNVTLPADAGVIWSFLESLSTARVSSLIATRKSGWTDLGLDGTRTVKIIVKGESAGATSDPILELTIGSSRSGDSQGGQAGSYLAFAGSEHAYLADASIRLETDMQHWELKTLIDLKPETIKSITYTPFKTLNKTTVTLERDAGGSTFHIRGGPPSGMDLNTAAVTSAASLLQGVRMSRRVDPSNEPARTALASASEVVVALFDGREVHLRVGRLDDKAVEYFIDAKFTGGANNLALDTATAQVNTLMQAWRYAFPKNVGERFESGLSDFVAKAAPAQNSAAPEAANQGAPASGG